MIQIPPPILLLPQLPTIFRDPVPHALKLGQILEAKVLSENLNGQIKLSIGDNKLTAQTPMQVTPGQNLTLQVIRTGPLPELKLLPLNDPQQLQTEALKRLLPKQRPLTELFEKFSPMQFPANQNTDQRQVKQAVQALLTRLLTVEQPQFKQGIRTALLDSGLFTEHHLINQDARGNDLKLNLLRLYEQVKTMLSQSAYSAEHKSSQGREHGPNTLQAQSGLKQLTDLLKQLDAAIARIQVNQLASLPQDDASRQVWQFELPLLHKDQVDIHQIMIKREGSGTGDENDTVWSLTLQMNLQPLGPMRVQLSLQGKALTTLIWVERQDTKQRLERRLPELQQAFEQADLEVTRLQAYQATIATPEPIQQVTGLVSEKA